MPEPNTARSARYEGASRATFSGIADLFRRRERIGVLDDGDRIDGKCCLVTGANRGLGKAVAVELARRGGRVVMACRSGYPQAAGEVKAQSGSERVEMAHVDLSNFESVERFAAEMKRRRNRFDIVVLNAGIVPSHARKTAQGFEEMFTVNYLASFLLLKRLLDGGMILAPSREQSGDRPGGDSRRSIPRIVFVSSEVHRSAPPIDFHTMGAFKEYGMRGAMAQYAVNKLLTSTFAVELSRRLQIDGRPQASVHHLCPGPINSDIAREAPVWIKPLLRLIFLLLFRSPRRAAEPAVYLCCSRAIEGRTGIYLHLMTEKSPSGSALDEQAGRQLWQASERLIRFGPPDAVRSDR